MKKKNFLFLDNLNNFFLKLGGEPAPAPNTAVLLGDIFGLAAPTFYVAPKVQWLPAEKGKGLEIWGTFSRR